MTFTGPEKHPIEFTMLVAPDADLELHDLAGKAICQFLIEEHWKLSDTMGEDYE